VCVCCSCVAHVSEAGVEREALEAGALRSDAAGVGGGAWLR
jgi:hypothetical protein